MVIRPGQTGDDIFEPIDFQVWQTTGQRRPARKAATAQPSSRRSSGHLGAI
jgi:hypothetical protein